jgi:hypothetical protein
MTCGSAFGIRWQCNVALSSLALGALLCSTGLRPAFAEQAELRAPDWFVQTENPQDWQPVLEALGWRATKEPARFRIVVGDSPAARKAGFVASKTTVRVASVIEERDPSLEIVWQQALDLPVYTAPGGAAVFAREKWTGAPLLAGLRNAEGGTLWAAVGPGTRGYDRFPYLPQALFDLGLTPPLRGSRLWAFFDYSYRTAVDLDYMAFRWREAGIAALHVSAWHFHERSAERDSYLENLIAACHRQGVLVYAWFELPHVSEVFWQQHPGCREKTAALQDAQLDWRKLMNLADPACFDRAAEGVKELLASFDWDGVNVAEMYFESLHGPANPQRFTPMNDWVRRDFEKQAAIDPLVLFEPESPNRWSLDGDTWARFADYRAELALSLQRRLFSLVRETAPQLDLVVTQIDDRFDTRMREYLGADAGALLGFAEEYDFTLAVEDPATLWNLGPDRYPEIAARYRPLVAHPERLAVDINIVERYQQTYPTRKQVGIELFQLVHMAGEAFSRLLLYFEHSISRPDWELLPYSAGIADLRRDGGSLQVETPGPVGVTWRGPAEVDGKPWPARDDRTLWLPPGVHVITPGGDTASPRLLYLSADLLAARGVADGFEFEYHSRSRAIALLDRESLRVTVDGVLFDTTPAASTGHWALRLPRGRHWVRMSFGSH